MLSFLRRLSDGGRSVLLITHNLDAALQVADKVAVVQDGMTVEMGSSRMFREKNAARHPYSRQLFDALPQNGFTASVNGKNGAAGANSQAKGCVFYSYCSEAKVICLDSLPPRKKTEGGWVRCHAA
jgi:peptide/nickel transport system ATP-binding protein